MGSDRARDSYDPGKRYTGVVMQQGRVFLEADWNEAADIASDLNEAEVREIVGVCGTPDNGYEVFVAKNDAGEWDRNFAVGPGSMYVGGVRVTVPAPVKYLAQRQLGWLDMPIGALSPHVEASRASREFVYLTLSEQEVSAIEDPTLREVALGGPDTAQRKRLMQHAECRALEKGECVTALAELEAAALAKGLKLDHGTAQLVSLSRLKVGFTDAGGGDGKCDPAAQGGYLGADNQLIRVQVSGAGKLLWSFDNASFLYRAKVVNSTTLTLKPQPVDAFHQPRKGQAIEVLLPTAHLAGDEWVAAGWGFVTTAAAAYDPDTQTLVLTDALAGLYLAAAEAKVDIPLFVRVWEQEKPFTADTAVTLDGSGLQVTMHGGPFVVGDYWQIAVRPAIEADPLLGIPGQVFPRRFQESFQPPDGPRRWVCPLAVIDWTDAEQPVTDCRNHFEDLVALTGRRGCCTVTLRPSDLHGRHTLQWVVDRYCQGGPVTVCLKPGKYVLREPLRLGPQHSHLTLAACQDGVVFEAAPGSLHEFVDGLVVLTHADDVTIRGIRFHLPLVAFAKAGGKLADVAPVTADELQTVAVSIGLHTVHCANLAVEGCLFRFSLLPEAGGHVLGIGMLSASECWGLRLEGNRFLHQEQHNLNNLLAGFVLFPTLLRAAGQKQAQLATTLLNDALIRDNRFSGVTLAAVIAANAAGAIRIEDNRMLDCAAGLLFGAGYLPISSQVVAGAKYKRMQEDAPTQVAAAMSTAADQPGFQRLASFAAAYPMPKGFTPERLRQGSLIEELPDHSTPAAVRRVVQSVLDRTVEIRRAAVRDVADVPDVKPKPADTDATRTVRRSDANVASDATKPEAAEAVRVEPTASAEAPTIQARAYATVSSLVNVIAASQESTHGLSLELHIESNTVDAEMPDLLSLWAMMVIDLSGVLGAVTVAANRLRSKNPLVWTGQLLTLSRASVIGNVVINEYPVQQAPKTNEAVVTPNALRVICPHTAVTGNVILGNVRLPARAAGLPAWVTYNDVS